MLSAWIAFYRTEIACKRVCEVFWRVEDGRGAFWEADAPPAAIARASREGGEDG